MDSEPTIPAGLAWLRDQDDGREWLARLPELVHDSAERWSLRLGRPYAYAFASLALPATLADGTPAVLKVQYPGRESEHEADALAAWGGEGAVRLLAHDADRHALLIERCDPGTPLSDLAPADALEVLMGLLPRSWKPAGHPFRPLADEAAWWAEYLPVRWKRAGKPFERRLLHAALDALEHLTHSQGQQVLVNQDLHADNVLRAEREPWLVIDPKPLAGEREFGIVAIVRGHELGHGESFVRHRLDRLCTDLDLDRERARGWALAQTLAWSIEDDGVLPEHVEIARWLLDLS